MWDTNTIQDEEKGTKDKTDMIVQTMASDDSKKEQENVKASGMM